VSSVGYWGLAWAHARRPGSKSLLVGGIAALAAASLVVALALSGAIADNTRRFIVDKYSGEIVVAQGPSAALFGYAVITGNERQDSLREAGRARAIVKASGYVDRCSPLLCGYLELVRGEGRDERGIAFGIDEGQPGPSGLGYALEPGSRLPGRDEILVSVAAAKRLAGADGKALALGDIVTAAALKDAGMGLRPLRVSGLYDYDGGVSELDRIVYLEAGTARRLLLNAEDSGARKAASSSPTPSDDQLFAAETLVGMAAPIDEAAAAPRQPAQTTEADIHAAAAAPDDRWQYLRLKLKDGARPAAAIASLNASFEAAGLGERALSWEEASSGYASSAGIVRAILLGGIAVVAAFALLVLANALGMLVSTRVRSIATMRALGATRSFVCAWIVAEALIAAAIGAAAGAAIAALFLELASAAAPAIANPALREVFSVSRFVARARPDQLAAASLLALGAAASATIGALLAATRASPASAMRG
jgi:ABC-type transport system, involved in lipoprotein release, permease component